ncbi:MAG TPA: hypothetical protein VH601_13420 [Bryobacteraceae bacterium]
MKENYLIDLSVAGKAPKADRAELEYFTRPTKTPVAFFMYPQAETSAGRVDSLDPNNLQSPDGARMTGNPETGRAYGAIDPP